MDIPKYSRVLNSSRYLHQLQVSDFDECYYGPRTCFLDLLVMAIGYVLPEQAEGLGADWQPWLWKLDLLHQWIRYVREKISQWSAWDSLRTEARSLLGSLRDMDFSSVDVEDVRLIEEVLRCYEVSVVWFEEMPTGQIKTKFFRCPPAGNYTAFVYMGQDKEQIMYAFHHRQQSDIASAIYSGPVGLQPPVVIGSPPFTGSPEELFLQIATSIVTATTSAVPKGVYSPQILIDAKNYLTTWGTLSSQMPALPPPLDSASLNDCFNTLLGSSSTVSRRPDHSVANCVNFPDFDKFIPHGEGSTMHYFHVTCLRDFVGRKRQKVANQPVLCPLCLKPLNEALLESEGGTQAKTRVIQAIRQG